MTERIYISPSLMCADLLQLPEIIPFLNEHADFLHIDIMDGHFVKNLVFSPVIVENLRPICTLCMDCHLMVNDPQDYLMPLLDAGAGCITLHAETIQNNAFRCFKTIHDHGCLVGLACSPSTPLQQIHHLLPYIDKLTVMTVDPGFAGQPFIEEMLNKIKEAKELREKHAYSYWIEADGQCNANTIGKLKNAGTDVFIVGASGLFTLDLKIETAWEKMMAQFQKTCNPRKGKEKKK